MVYGDGNSSVKKGAASPSIDDDMVDRVCKAFLIVFIL